MTVPRTPPEDTGTDIETAMRLAIAVSEDARGLSGTNPPVGAVILDADGRVAGVGHTREPGGPHAEIVALAEAGERARGGTAVVTLEPCDHTGRTGPCSRALIGAGIAAVHYAVADPNAVASGGAGTLASAGVSVRGGILAAEAELGPLRAWLHRQRTGRPHVTLKLAVTADGRVAAADGTSRWITGPSARRRVHTERARIDAIVVGTGTLLADDPALTARDADGGLADRQPLRAVAGLRDVPAGARIRDDHDGRAPWLHVRERDPRRILEALGDVADVQIEGGATLAGAFLAAGLVDRVQLYSAPVFLGAGKAAVGEAGVATIADAHRFRRVAVEELGEDLLITLAPPVPPGP